MQSSDRFLLMNWIAVCPLSTKKGDGISIFQELLISRVPSRAKGGLRIAYQAIRN